MLERLEILDPRWCEPAPPNEVQDAVAGRRIERLARRGKYLVLELEDDVHLVMHLRMTGNLLLAPSDGSPSSITTASSPNVSKGSFRPSPRKTRRTIPIPSSTSSPVPRAGGAVSSA